MQGKGQPSLSPGEQLEGIFRGCVEMHWPGTLCAVPLPSAGWPCCAAAAAHRRHLPVGSAAMMLPLPTPPFYDSEPKVMIIFLKLNLWNSLTRVSIKDIYTYV